MKKLVLSIVIAVVLLLALAFMASMKDIDFTETVKGWFSSDEAPTEQTEVIGEVVSGKYELVNFSSEYYETDPGFQDEKVVFGLYVENNDGKVDGYNVSKVSWERVGDVIFYKLGVYEIAPDIPSGVNLYADFGVKGSKVSDEFMTWFKLHFKAVDEIPDITCTISGKYKFKDTVLFSLANSMTQELAFASGDTIFNKVYVSAVDETKYCDVYYCTSDTYNKVYSYSEGWLDESYMIVEIPETTVTMKFNMWFTSMATPYVDGEDPGENVATYKISAGEYKFNDIVYPDSGDLTQEISGNWNGESFTAMRVGCIDGHPNAPVFEIYINGGSTAVYYDSGFTDHSWETSFTLEECYVSEAFYKWFDANAIRVG